jgi:hypothetical protein
VSQAGRAAIPSFASPSLANLPAQTADMGLYGLWYRWFYRDLRHPRVTLITWKKWLLWASMLTGLKKTMSPETASLLRFPGNVFRQSLSPERVAFGPLAFRLPSSRCQMDPRLPSTCRIASVALLAARESLSVGAAPTAIPLAVQPGAMPAAASKSFAGLAAGTALRIGLFYA